MPDPDGSRRINTPTPPETSTVTRTEKTISPTDDREHPAPGYTPPPAPVHLEPAPETRPARAAKTSAAAVFALVFGLAALFCALTAILSPAAIVFGIIGLVLAVVGFKMSKKPGVTGHGVAVGGLVTALLGLILGGVVLGGLAAVVNNKSQLDRIQSYIDTARAKLPSTQDVRNQVPGQ